MRKKPAIKPDEPVKITQWPIGKLIEYANNPREHESAIDKMATTIKEFGFKVPIIATSKGEVVDGHLRLKASRALGLKTVPVILADDLTPAQIKAFRINVNASTDWASWAPAKLELELTQLRAMDFDLEKFGLDAIELPELDEVVAATPRANRSKTTIFLSIANEQVEKARKVVAAALEKARIPHNL